MSTESDNFNALAERQIEAIRHALTERRRESSMSMSELGRKVGVSPSMISQIERGQTLPSVGTLFALAAALGVTVDAFLTQPTKKDEADTERAAPASVVEAHEATAQAADGPVREPIEAMPTPAREGMYVVRHDDRASVPIRGGVTWERLTPRSLEDVEFLELDYAPYAESDDELYRHPGIEMVLVLEGRFEIHVGFETYALEVGDSMLFPSSLPHRYVNPTGERSRAVTVILRDAVGSAGGVSAPEPAEATPAEAGPPPSPDKEE
ncbi:MAG TPA: helix-turn-helix domain-containing protein [Solirubrobacterales bacterium]|nr:helix-turn-helix domain-containing protein [Solirubrobacterales bacterium]